MRAVDCDGAVRETHKDAFKNRQSSAGRSETHMVKGWNTKPAGLSQFLQAAPYRPDTRPEGKRD
jgi:hypothetical protein